MPNESAAVCGCGIALDLPPSRNGSAAISTKTSNPLVGKLSSLSRWETWDRKNRCGNDTRGPAPRPPETGCASSTSDQRRGEKQSSKQGKRLNSSRRTRSAERPDSHYTYIDSVSSVASNASIREDAIPEGLYATIDDPPSIGGTTGNVNPANNRTTVQNHPQAIYPIPSMTSPPPTYDAAMWQSGLPPSYEEYLCHKYASISRSHTPPPPWSDSSEGNVRQIRRELLASQPDLREYLCQLAREPARFQAQNHARNNNNQTTTTTTTTNTTTSRHQRVLRECTTGSSNQTGSRDQASRMHRNRAPTVRSQSESRARQQRIATMYEDGAFCMETAAIQCAFDNGVAFCSLM